MSVRQMSNGRSLSKALAVRRLLALVQEIFIRPSVISSSSRMSGSSAMISAVCIASVQRVLLVRMGETDAEAAAFLRRGPEVERRLVGLAQLARDVEAEPGTARFGREERFEDLLEFFRVDPGAGVDHFDVRPATVPVYSAAQGDERHATA